MTSQKRYATFAWGVLAYTLVVIMWGAYVRASGSGAGCGSHWPLCNGQVVPRDAAIETLVEFSHRITSALTGFLTLALVGWGWKAFPKGHLVRKAALATLFFVLLEGAVGALQVRLDLTADNDSVGRAWIGGIHLINTFFLTAAMMLTAWWASGARAFRLRGQGVLGWLYAFGVVAVLLVGAAGAVTALGDTLFPVDTLHEGIRQDFSPTAHFMIRLRVYHPVVAVLTSVYLIAITRYGYTKRPSAATRWSFLMVSGLFVAQLVVGVVNMILLVPIAMQLIHLLMADVVWLVLILAIARTFEVPAEESVYVDTSRRPSLRPV